MFNDSWGAVLVFGFLLGFAGASFAVGIPFVSGWYPAERQGFALGIYGMGMGGTVLGALTAPAIVDAFGLSAPFWIAAALLAAMAVTFLDDGDRRPGRRARERPARCSPPCRPSVAREAVAPGR